ncbi:MAG: C45 family autoproteolytic acyltransferase/hydrolase [Candidatus Bipolaricaulis anaerobius]|nr:C45 family autoproteolytic acyltransferase/hydrolase [Candidatus Bipolaricaulis anaerobius]
MTEECPLLDLAGDPYTIGYGHGRGARALIATNLALYTRRYRDEIGLGWEEVLRRAGVWFARVAELDPPYAAMVEGVAAGSGFPLPAIAALNARYELFYGEFAATGLATACTSFALLPARTGGRLLLGENWDWFPDVEGLWLRVAWGDLTVIAFTEAGIAGGKIGLNSAGIGLAVNGLLSHRDHWDGEGVPFHVRTWRVLSSPDLERAIAAVADGGAPGSANFLVGDATTGEAVSLERAPNGTARVEPADGILVHANHFLAKDTLDVREPLAEERRSTDLRQRRLTELLVGAAGRGPLSLASVQDSLRDHEGHPDSVCRHESPLFPLDLNYRTSLSVVMDLGAGRIHYTARPPCQSPYRTLGA